MPIQAIDIIELGASEVLKLAVNLTGQIGTDTISGTPTAAVLPAAAPAPTVTGIAANSSEITVKGESVAALKGIQFTLTANSAAKGLYTITFLWVTTGGQTMQSATKFRII